MKALVEKYNSLTDQQKRRGLIGLLVVLGLLGIWLSGQDDQSASQPLIPTEVAAPLVSNIHVHIVGEVAFPGLYELPVGSRVADAINLSGGMSANAAQESVNLARILSDGEQVPGTAEWPCS